MALIRLLLKAVAESMGRYFWHLKVRDKINYHRSGFLTRFF